MPLGPGALVMAKARREVLWGESCWLSLRPALPEPPAIENAMLVVGLARETARELLLLEMPVAMRKLLVMNDEHLLPH